MKTHRRGMTDIVTATAEPVGHKLVQKDEHGWNHFAYTVTLSYQGRTMETPFKTGTAWTTVPTAADVLYSLLSDASGIDNAAGSFEDWAGEYGYDTDSRKAEAAYQATLAQTQRLRALLGDAYSAAVFPPDDHEAAAARLAGKEPA